MPATRRCCRTRSRKSGFGAPDVQKVQLAAVDSALRFAEAFPQDPRGAPVLTNAAEKLYALNDGERASAVARQVLALQPAPPAAAAARGLDRGGAHVVREGLEFVDAERAYGEVLALTPEKDAARAALTERLAASVYKQGEAARAQGQLPEAIGHYTRVATVAPASPVRATAQYDAAAAMLSLKDWDGAARTLEDFRTRYPKHPLQDEVSAKLAVAYVEKGNWAQAAANSRRLAAAQQGPAAGARRPLAGGRNVREGWRARIRLRAPTSATSSSTPSRWNPRWRRAIDWRGSRARTAMRRANRR